ncbi:putative ArsR family transcriptional regulator [Paucibacter oligotrophus]|uniref:Putative ArsR family transcriptional regulator n=1 Tax=Roseateles oligotrophus TaxID=1769250 RepID=A0A840L6W5_9BURK|nr:MarR family transcriptional regulator [Roseateles oligotrophus]MBB4843910.1 putative ArsR family transcriptional regulator [Roseateles oligotrophus]
MKGRAEQLLFQLKSRGPQPAATLAAACAITPMGAHKQLQELALQGLVQAQDEARGVGRPTRVWRLSEAGHARFPDRHADLALALIRHTAELLGPAALEQLIAAREQASEATYLARMAGKRSLLTRLQALAAARAEEGYMARVEVQGRGANQVLLLIEDHCPICAAARECQGFCRSELALFQRCLGPQVALRRSEHVLAGARRCVYEVRAS